MPSSASSERAWRAILQPRRQSYLWRSRIYRRLSPSLIRQRSSDAAPRRNSLGQQSAIQKDIRCCSCRNDEKIQPSLVSLRVAPFPPNKTLPPTAGRSDERPRDEL